MSSLLALDLYMFHGKRRALGTREALLWSIAWIAVALLFNGLVYFQFGTERGLEFLTGYLIEKALAVDNLFVFALIFSYFGIPSTRQHRRCSSRWLSDSIAFPSKRSTAPWSEFLAVQPS